MFMVKNSRVLASFIFIGGIDFFNVFSFQKICIGSKKVCTVRLLSTWQEHCRAPRYQSYQLLNIRLRAIEPYSTRILLLDPPGDPTAHF